MRVRVVCRFRPANEREKREIIDAGKDGAQIEFVDDKTVKVNLPGGKDPMVYAFDNVFHDDVAQAHVFENTARETVEDVLAGYNGTIFAYGQTGSGKTHTMFGPDISSEEFKGIIPRACSLIFQHVDKQQGNGTEFTVKCSFLEIYKEVIHDLLDPTKSNLKVRETPTMGVWVEGLSERVVYNETQILELLKLGEQHRSVSKTLMNATSSRSHSLFIISVVQKLRNGSTKTGKLNLADLAGSEKVGKTGASGDTLEEAKKINQSLSALGNCIMALTKSKKSHIPYRDSKLTFILRESLGGNAKTTLLIAGSPHVFNLEETVSTLRFGQRAKAIKNKVKINAQRSVQELELIIKKLTFDLKVLKQYVSLIEVELLASKERDFDFENLRMKLLDQVNRQFAAESSLASGQESDSLRRNSDSAPTSPSAPVLSPRSPFADETSPQAGGNESPPDHDDDRDPSTPSRPRPTDNIEIHTPGRRRSGSFGRSRSSTSVPMGTSSTAEFPNPTMQSVPMIVMANSPSIRDLSSPARTSSPARRSNMQIAGGDVTAETPILFDPMALAEVRAAYDTLKEDTDLRIQDLTDEINALKDQLREAQGQSQEAEIDRLTKENEALRTQLAQQAVGAVKDSLVSSRNTLGLPGGNKHVPTTKHHNTRNRDTSDEEEMADLSTVTSSQDSFRRDEDFRSDLSYDGDSLPRDVSGVSSRFSSGVPSNQTSVRNFRTLDEEDFQDKSHGSKNRSRSNSHSSTQLSPRSKQEARNTGLSFADSHQLYTWMTLALKYDAASRHKQVSFSQTSELFEFLLENKVAPSSWADFISKALETNSIPRQMLKNASTRFN